MASQTKGMSFALSGALLMSMDAVFIRLSGLDGFSASFLFGVFSFLSMMTLTHVRERGILPALKAGGIVSVLSGMIMGVSGTSFVLAVHHTTVANVVLIQSLSPFFSAIFSRILLGEKTDRATAIAMLVSLVGIAIIVHGSLGGELLGDMIALLCSLAVSLNFVVWRKYKGISRSLVIGLGGVFIALFSSPFVSYSAFDLANVLIMAAMGLLSAPIGRTFMATSARYITAMEVSLIGRINVIVAPFIVWLIFAELPSNSTFLGGGILIAAIFGHAFVKLRAERRKAAAKAEAAWTEAPVAVPGE